MELSGNAGMSLFLCFSIDFTLQSQCIIFLSASLTIAALDVLMLCGCHCFFLSLCKRGDEERRYQKRRSNSRTKNERQTRKTGDRIRCFGGLHPTLWGSLNKPMKSREWVVKSVQQIRYANDRNPNILPNPNGQNETIIPIVESLKQLGLSVLLRDAIFLSSFC